MNNELREATAQRTEVDHYQARQPSVGVEGGGINNLAEGQPGVSDTTAGEGAIEKTFLIALGIRRRD